ncbi:2-succinyl-5-enolpyruvyl-6-hydroxy-3-cyclohexene-1-carboxylate synthase [Parvicella tangerina]|uniref:2-succinyl-5-enolpyruvyl-6-hydroxy-3-cyclohexene-1-carboxylate synthase n=1 Tax=Parvicella tangerina TaxID=2829795 RepID=A0A916JQ21_9FLAO|nr:2-succinyl-5-enolpyruvyl-6-hydroxy-3-cyclohexene-1-carboxylate synthase [Parvicella tangerina]
MGIVDWVISPGSRNAPITLTFANDPRINSLPVVDERSAAFIALGIGIRKGTPAAISCTSGSAALNYAPAIAEAYHQEVPLFIVTADRPQKWIGNGEGQSIDQVNVYQNYCLSSYHLNEDDSEELMIETFQKIVGDLFGHKRGPVHLNLAFEEPLYGTQDAVLSYKFNQPEIRNELWKSEDLVNKYLKKKRVMVLVGQMSRDERLEYLLSELLVDKRLVVLTETNANLSHRHFVSCIDRSLPSLDQDQFLPELVITVGGAIVSKRIKKYLRSVPNLEHWHVSDTETFPDTFESLTERIFTTPTKFFRAIFDSLSLESNEDYQSRWVQRSFINKERHEHFVSNVQWSDLKAHALIYEWIPDGAILHQGNSSVVRYYQLFDPIKEVLYLSNRGVSGIDGIVSTALGFAHNDDRMNVVVVGDLSFQYDINALWNALNTDNVLIIVINNGGGGIFKIIDGPSSTGVLEDYFQVKSTTDLESLCKSYGKDYKKVYQEEGLEIVLMNVIAAFQANTFSGLVLEVDTSGVASAEILRDYFNEVNPQ